MPGSVKESIAIQVQVFEWKPLVQLVPAMNAQAMLATRAAVSTFGECR